MKERAQTRTRETLSRPSLARGQTQTSTVLRARHKTVHTLAFFFLCMHGPTQQSKGAGSW